ncbi:muconate cycloisomerase family protein [Salicibibacter cibarius]|uniref:Muconate cycloisomerase family protein n=1 Tax=Salicibibacter cibarius TaxID=2743000 RepID=A0A7T6YZY1_9BACI|nr:muconate cycloisomerase family protein [Salicibibacter cibarius]QQK74395.1 muconate cycloisomerase family protein [Salicibibacter cibarius]
MTIKQGNVYIADIPISRPHQLSMHTITKQTIVLVKLTEEDGLSGWGEVATIGGASYEEMTPEAIKVTIDHYLMPMILGKKAADYACIMNDIQKHVKGNRFAKAAVESALIDLFAKQKGLPAYELLGGKIHDSLPVAWTLASGDTKKDIEEAQEALQQRKHRIFKLKIGKGDPNENVRHVLEIKKALGDEVRVTVDVNQSWDEQTANQCIPKLQAGGIVMVEQPLPEWNEEGMRRLTASSALSVMADEGARSIHDVFRIAKHHVGDSLSLKIPKHGGPHETKKAAAIAESAGMPLYGGTMIESTLGTAIAAHVYATIPDMIFGTELFGPLLYQDMVSTNALIYENYELIIPERPGFGITIDEDKVLYYARDHETRQKGGNMI